MSSLPRQPPRQYQKRDLKPSVSSVSSSYSDDASRLKAELEKHGIKGIDEELIQDMATDHISMGLIEDELGNFADDYDLQVVTCRQKLLHFLRSNPVTITLMVLVIVDIFVIIGMTIIDLYIGDERVKEVDKEGLILLNYGKSFCPDFASLNVSKLEYASKAIYKKRNYGIGGYPNDAGYPADGNAAGGINPYASESGGRVKRGVTEDNVADYKEHNRFFTIQDVLENFHHGLHVISIIILGIFVLELCLKLLAMGMRFFRHKTEILDGIVIIVSFVMDIVLTDSTTTHKLGKFILIIFLLARVVKVANVMMMKSRLRTLFRMRLLKKAQRYTNALTGHLDQDVTDLRLEIKQMQELCRKYGVPAAEYTSEDLQSNHYGKKSTKLKKTFSSILSLNKSPSTSSFQTGSLYRQKSVLSQTSSISSFTDIRGPAGKAVLKRNASEAQFRLSHPKALSNTKVRSNSSIELNTMDFN